MTNGCCYTLLLFLCQVLWGGQVYAQTEKPDCLARIYEDNDFMNLNGPGTDDSYTAGTRLDIYFTKKAHPRFFIDRLMPKAGDSAVNVYGWGLMQILFTPDDLSVNYYQPGDYPYSAALFITHSLYSYHPEKKYTFQTELVLGVMGPAALGEQTQALIHRIMQFVPPQGWANQKGNAPLVNINFVAEKQLATIYRSIDIIGGGGLYAGSMINAVSVYALIRIGIMNPYFDGYISQYAYTNKRTPGQHHKKLQAYLIMKPQGEYVVSNSLLQGGLFAKNPEIPYVKSNQNNNTPPPALYFKGDPEINHFVAELDYGSVLCYGHFSVSYTQKPTTAYLKSLYNHNVGNVTVGFNW